MDTESAYQACIEWLFERFPSYQHLGSSAYKPGLDRVEQLLDLLEIDKLQIPCIHIAGTNGKGSTAAYCASLLQEKGLKVGLFTSPHIFDFSERIRVNGKPIPAKEVIFFCKQYQSLLKSVDASFFELTFAMALQYFELQKCDYLVIETGMGGRLDATNILLPKVSIITNIGLDHQGFLGNSLAAIAQEKAGIIKSNTPVVVGEKSSSIRAIFEKQSNALNAPLTFADDFQLALELDILKGYQINNFKAAMAALDMIGFKFSISEQTDALENLKDHTGFFGRLETWQDSPKIIIDVSHNAAGIQASIPLIKQACSGQLFIIYGASKDKDSKEICCLFPKEATLAACVFSNPRSKSRLDWKNLGIETIFDDLASAISTIEQKMKVDDLLWITGSFFLLSDLPSQKKIF